MIDISSIPFSRYGAYVSVTRDDGRKSLTLRYARSRPGEDAAFELILTRKGRAVDYVINAEAEALVCISSEGTLRIYIRDDETVAFDSERIDLFFHALDDRGYGSFGTEDGDNSFRIIETGRRIHALFVVQAGSGTMTGPLVSSGVWKWNGLPVNHKGDLLIRCDNNRITAALHISNGETKSIPLPIEPEKEIKTICAEWESFLSKLPDSRRTGEEKEFEAVTWYNLWSCFVRARDVYRSDVMLMSKKTMTAVWAWDHCFNALAMSHIGKKEALEQFMAPFHLQDENGALPDLWNPGMEVLWNFTKPPIHGWCFNKLMDSLDYPPETLKAVYGHLEKQLNWWFAFRDEDVDGIPCYAHGNDSGWDNSTIFDNGYYVAAPDLSAFIVLQMHTLARIADTLGMTREVESWRTRAKELLKKLIAVFWKGGRFVALQNHTGDYRPDPSSLQVHLPVILGEYLDKEIMAAEATVIEKRFLTEHGLATEAPDSERYESDGYWRGPIWAPPTYLIVDGLRRGGYEKLAETIARRYIRLSCHTAKGNYENFDALTGKGLRAPGYTWSASVYMLLCWEYPSSVWEALI